MTDPVSRPECEHKMERLDSTLVLLQIGVSQLNTHLEHSNAIFEAHKKDIVSNREEIKKQGERLASIGVWSVIFGVVSGVVAGVGAFFAALYKGLHS